MCGPLPFFVEVKGRRAAVARRRGVEDAALRTVEKWDVGRPAPRPPCPFAVRRSLADRCRGRRPRRPAEVGGGGKVRGRDESLPYGLSVSGSLPGGGGGVKTPPYGVKDKQAAVARPRAGHARPLRTAVKIYGREGQGRAAAHPFVVCGDCPLTGCYGRLRAAYMPPLQSTR